MGPKRQIPRQIREQISANRTLRGDGIVQHGSYSNGRTSSLSVPNLLPQLPKVGGDCFIAQLTTCPDTEGNHIGKVKLLNGYFWGSHTLETEEIEVQCPSGMRTRKDQICLIVGVGNTTNVPYVLIDIVDWYLRQPATGTYQTVNSATLAPYQYQPSGATCSGT